MNELIASVKINGLIRYLLKRIKLRFLVQKNLTKFVTIYGKEVALNTIDLEQKYFIADCIREPENLFIYRALSEAGLTNCFVDIGANCGHVAASIVDYYQTIILFEPNPKLAKLLKNIFSDHKNISIKECAIVGAESVGTLSLTVPQDSSGLATLGGTALSHKHKKVDKFKVSAKTLESELSGVSISNAYIKIDVEGYEYDVIKSSQNIFLKDRPIVGFEALSLEAAKKCCLLFKGHNFYIARFNFLENNGALTNSLIGVVNACVFGGTVDFIKIDDMHNSKLTNFSQIFSVPQEKTLDFENAIKRYSERSANYKLNTLRSWMITP